MALWLAAAPAGALEGLAARAEPCACPEEPGAPAGVIWRGPAPIPISDLAAQAAPVVWFSPDEPLLTEGTRPPPDPHPCDAPSDTPVVYWSVDRLRLRGDSDVARPLEDDPRFLEKVRTVILRYFFYYRLDIGAGAHLHDIEMLDLEISLEQSPGGWEARVIRAIGRAHGVDWYSNELAIERDAVLPIHVLVEEGKHASCPDRNADGAYTPGYDVNRRVNDAWGVRDVLGSGFLGEPAYQASQSKQRAPRDRVLPPEPGPCCPHPKRVVHPEDREFLARYALRRARDVGMCPGIVDRGELEASMRLNHFGLGYQPPQLHLALEDSLLVPLSGTGSLLPSVALRWDRDLGLAFLLRGFDLHVTYLVPRFTVIPGSSLSAEVLLTNSAARFQSPYLSLGAEREKRPGSGYRWDFVAEAGLKFRVTVPGWYRVFSLGYQFAGIRLGVRSSGFDSLERLRFVVEVGAGVW